ncbi:MgtC/SapB family protein [Frateuria aurantia]|uniref:Protein MgtC n=1 Tax=Frateuria aurantia (strain ATCC 33424 / DSM 6220 / KCTC 2777 / LMG 1558 / NBRC 3245 / NCIMB 13370) TaxID=767434 RepID=H8L0F5_FRAAD|nr:MgtC/SapB family protein [Frateuria aurantia]AFC87450.1 putative membrane protein [Frateuria aurantia DSM 6220]
MTGGWQGWMEPHGESLVQLGELVLALVLSSLIGLEREFRLKSAGLRTHALVGLSSALIMIVSKYGFGDVVQVGSVILDPSRIAAQIVSGIGFIGGGLIFVQRDTVRGLTTAAIIWLCAAVGMAAGAGLPWLAVFATALHFCVVYGYTVLTRSLWSSQLELVVDYLPGKNAVQTVIELCTGRGYVVHQLAVQSQKADDEATASVRVQLSGRAQVAPLLVALGDVKGVLQVRLTPMESLVH